MGGAVSGLQYLQYVEYLRCRVCGFGELAESALGSPVARAGSLQAGLSGASAFMARPARQAQDAWEKKESAG